MTEVWKKKTLIKAQICSDIFYFIWHILLEKRSRSFFSKVEQIKIKLTYRESQVCNFLFSVDSRRNVNIDSMITLHFNVSWIEVNYFEYFVHLVVCWAAFNKDKFRMLKITKNRKTDASCVDMKTPAIHLLFFSGFLNKAWIRKIKEQFLFGTLLKQENSNPKVILKIAGSCKTDLIKSTSQTCPWIQYTRIF